MPTARIFSITAVLAVTALLAAGCQSARPFAWDEPDHGLLHSQPGPSRSLVMDAQSQQLASAAAGPGAFDPWYLGRNDEVPFVVYGERVSVPETTFTLSRDQQSIRNGRAVDRFNQTTFRRRVQRTTR